ncbi:hypothetical protein [Lysobacter sp. 1R34A]|uniref:hypothetical protein n=1 Tax=Lysobacter sp. 1R34A TaxID=3445786 RepID=UPI003EEA4020
MDISTQQQIGEQLARVFAVAMLASCLAGLCTRAFAEFLRDTLYQWRAWRRRRALQRRRQGRVL